MKYFMLKQYTLLVIFLPSYVNADQILELRKVKDFQHGYELRKEFLQYMVDLFHTEVFVETGTFRGDSSAHAAEVLKEVHSVEIDQKLQTANQERFSNNPRVHLYTGDTVKQLPHMINAMGNKKALFWIDAHWPEVPGASFRYPIIEELKIIAEIQDNNPVILIDDLRDFDMYGQGIVSVSKVFAAIKTLFPHYACYIYGDTVIAFSKDEPVKPSEFIQAITFHRLYFKDAFNLESISKREEIIMHAGDTELEALEDIAKTLPNTEYYSYWAAIINYERKNFTQALNWFNNAQKYGLTNAKIKNYIKTIEKAASK